MTKRFRMVAGPNGSGKLNSSLAIDVMDEAEALYGVWYWRFPIAGLQRETRKYGKICGY